MRAGAVVARGGGVSRTTYFDLRRLLFIDSPTGAPTPPHIEEEERSCRGWVEGVGFLEDEELESCFYRHFINI